MSVRFDQVRFSYPQTGEVLRSMTLEIPAGDVLLVVGRNGAGKSTVLRSMTGLLVPDSGTVTVDGLDASKANPTILASKVSVTFQNPADQLFASTVFNELLFGPKNIGRQKPDEDALRALEMFHLSEYRSMHPYDLSAASRKLVTIASAVATGAAYLAFDEPTVNLSHPERIVLRSAFQTLAARGTTLIVVSHDLEFCLPLCSRVAILSDGRVHWLGERSEFVRRWKQFERVGVHLPRSFQLREKAGLPVVPEADSRN